MVDFILNDYHNTSGKLKAYKEKLIYFKKIKSYEEN